MCDNKKIINYYQTHSARYYGNCVNNLDFGCNLWEEIEGYEFDLIKLDNGIVVSSEMNKNLNKFNNK